MATWTSVCGPCSRGIHEHCKGTKRNPCDCAANGHKDN